MPIEQRNIKCELRNWGINGINRYLIIPLFLVYPLWPTEELMFFMLGVRFDFYIEPRCP